MVLKPKESFKGQINATEATEEQLQEVFRILKDFDPTTTRADADRRVYDWILHDLHDFSDCLGHIGRYKHSNERYYKTGMDILKVFYGDILNSPLWKAMEEEE